MAYSISLTKRTNGGYTIVTEDYTCYPSVLTYHGIDGGVILFSRGLNLLRFYRPSEWTIQSVTGYTTVVQVCDALDALGISATEGTDDIEALLTTIDADTGSILTAVQLMDDDLDDARLALQVMDDWDESDRAKVNLIAGQAGVDGNSGNKSDKTVRVVLATDQPALTNKLLVTEDNSGSIKTAVELIDDAVYTDNSGTVSKGLLIMGADGNTPQAVKVNSDGELMINLESADIEIGAVEIKNSTDDTRATVGANGLYVDVRASALPSGAATETTVGLIKTAVEIIDDWDESDRAKVNIIAGQEGVAAGAGQTTLKTQRVVSAKPDYVDITSDTVIYEGYSNGTNYDICKIDLSTDVITREWATGTWANRASLFVV